MQRGRRCRGCCARSCASAREHCCCGASGASQGVQGGVVVGQVLHREEVALQAGRQAGREVKKSLWWEAAQPSLGVGSSWVTRTLPAPELEEWGKQKTPVTPGHATRHAARTSSSGVHSTSTASTSSDLRGSRGRDRYGDWRTSQGKRRPGWSARGPLPHSSSLHLLSAEPAGGS